jgi:hypothetical protein
VVLARKLERVRRKERETMVTRQAHMIPNA